MGTILLSLLFPSVVGLGRSVRVHHLQLQPCHFSGKPQELSIKQLFFLTPPAVIMTAVTAVTISGLFGKAPTQLKTQEETSF
jgi:hypothetical protein